VPEAARQLIKFLTGPIAIPVIKAQGMEPAGSISRGSHAAFDWKLDEETVTIFIFEGSSTEEAIKNLKFSLSTIQMPKYNPLSGLGEEAYLITSSGPIIFRRSNVMTTVVGISTQMEIVKRFAQHIDKAIAA
jgi:hypothetical protein